MKKGLKIFLIVVAVIVLLVLIAFARLGYLPGVAKVFGWDKPRDLGVSYTEEDFDSAFNKSAASYGVLPESTPDSSSIQFLGSNQVTTSWNSSEVTSLLNDRPWKYWPISDVQLKINEDNSVEMSGIINSNKLRGYAIGIGVPQAVVDRISLLPSEAPFYIKGTGSLSQNTVSSFDLTQAELGRTSIPTGILLSADSQMVKRALAQSVVDELSNYSGKKAYIVDFVNSKLSWVNGFFAKRAEFKNGSLEFEGTIPDKELTVR
jgi:hypothetical protein